MDYTKALETLNIINDAISSDEVAAKQLQDSLRINKRSVCTAIEKLEMEKITGFNLDYINDKWWKVSYYPEEIYLGYYDGSRKLTNIDEIPKDEWLVSFWFSCGAYSFHRDYPTETYNAFIEELLTYQPKYFDTINKHFYFDIEKGKEVVSVLPTIFNKYKDQVQKELDKKRIAKLEAELNKLKNN